MESSVKKKPAIGGALWWLFLIGTLITSFFTGYLVGKVLRRILIALALPSAVNTAIADGLGAGWITNKLQSMWFASPFELILVKPAQSNLREMAS